MGFTSTIEINLRLKGMPSLREELGLGFGASKYDVKVLIDVIRKGIGPTRICIFITDLCGRGIKLTGVNTQKCSEKYKF